MDQSGRQAGRRAGVQIVRQTDRQAGSPGHGKAGQGRARQGRADTHHLHCRTYLPGLVPVYATKIPPSSYYVLYPELLLARSVFPPSPH
jgi:hypothetical protein